MPKSNSLRYHVQAPNAISLFGSFLPMQQEKEIQAHRRKRLQSAIDFKTQGNVSEFGRLLNFKSGAFVRQMLEGTKAITEKTVAKVEALPKMQGWFAEETANTEKGPDVRGKVPLISSVTAGHMTESTDLHAPGVAEDWIDTTVPIHAHTYALRVKGDSMEPDFPEGCCIIVEPDLDPLPGDFVIAKNGGADVNFKQLVKDGADWYLKPLNSRYPIKPLGDSIVIGVVRELVRRFR